MESLTTVKIWDRVIGTASWWAEQNCAIFEYHPSWLKSGVELSPMYLPLRSGRQPFVFPELGKGFRELSDAHAFRGLPGMLADSMPDSFGVLLWAQKQGLTNKVYDALRTPVDWLRYIGMNGTGALTFHDPVGKENSSATTSVAEIYKEIQRLLGSEGKPASSVPLPEVVRSMTKSAGGARPKVLLAYDEGTGHAMSPQNPDATSMKQYLVKLDTMPGVPGSVPVGYTRAEMAYHLMALAAGIEMMPCQLLTDGSTTHFMTERFDRPVGKPRPHVQTLQALQHLSYMQQPGLGHQYETLFEWMLRLRIPASRREQLFRRMVFNVLAHNTDDHSRNHAFMVGPDGKWDLTPAYDLVFVSRGSPIGGANHALSINKKLTGIRLQDFEDVAQEYGVRNWLHLVQEVKHAVANCGHFLELADVPTSLRAEILETIEAQIRILE